MTPQDNARYQVSPVVDEWGIYDPDRAGLAAVFARVNARPLAPLSAGQAVLMASSMRAENDRTKGK